MKNSSIVTNMVRIINDKSWSINYESNVLYKETHLKVWHELYLLIFRQTFLDARKNHE